jgi:hypothetical protein
MFDYTKYSDVLITDSDDSYNLQDIKLMLDYYGSQSNISGYRVERSKNEPLWRRGYIKCEGLLMRLLFGIKMKDYTAVCRKLSLVWAGRVAHNIKYSPRSFWLEFDARWKHERYKPHLEVAIGYVGKPSKIYAPSKMPKIILQEFWALLKTRYELWK